MDLRTHVVRGQPRHDGSFDVAQLFEPGADQRVVTRHEDGEIRELAMMARLGMGGVQTMLPYALGHEFARLQRFAQMRGVQVQALATVPAVQ